MGLVRHAKKVFRQGRRRRPDVGKFLREHTAGSDVGQTGAVTGTVTGKMAMIGLRKTGWSSTVPVLKGSRPYPVGAKRI